MPANKFATMLHRNTQKITVILVYAVLEWLLIIFLLLNSSFTYLIRKFAKYFGLKPPCVWCSRVDHILERDRNTKSYRDLVCDNHASEISKLSYCSSHQRLAETQAMCTECLASRPKENGNIIGMTRIAFFSWVNAHKIDDDNQDFKCSCCNESLKRKVYPPYLLFKSSWDALDYNHKGRLIIEARDDGKSGAECEEQMEPDSLTNHDENDNEIGTNDGEECHIEKDDADEFLVISDVDSFGGLTEIAEENNSRSESNLQQEEQGVYEEEAGKSSAYNSSDDTVIRCCSGENNSLEIINLGSERNVDFGATRIIPIGLIDSLTTENKGFCNPKEELIKEQDHESEAFYSALQSETQANFLGQSELIGIDENTENTRCEKFDRSERDADKEVENPSVLKAEEETQDLVGASQFGTKQADQTLSIDGNEVEAETMNEKDNLSAPSEETKEPTILGDQTKSNDLSTTKAAVDADGHLQDQEPIFPMHDDLSPTTNTDAKVINIFKVNMVQNDLGQKQQETGIVVEKLNLVDKNEDGMNDNSSTRSELNEVEEERFPDTPTSLDSFHYLHKKLILFEKRESGMEESLDGSVASEMEGSDPILTVERLKSALKAERKSLSALYSELEEERSASAVAANQTMAMITRLQEEKAAMQMEALQYQRMMEEQAEYDQEALLILNELMVKTEKEKHELEKELEIHRKKVLDYEEQEKMRRRSINGSVRSRNSLVSCSNSEDTDEVSIDLNREAKDEDSSLYDHLEISSENEPADGNVNVEEMALDCVKHITALDESLSEFEEERLSILKQLNVLEEKLRTLGDDEFNEDFISIEQSPKFSVNEFDENHNFSSPVENGVSNGFSKDRLNPERISVASMAKSLLPLLDATANETEQGLIYEEQVELESVEMKNSAVSTFELDSKRMAIEEEVDHVYEWLQVLKADGEFIKHCMSSVNKGDKGMDLLQEILQHLRNLRAVEILSKNMSGYTL